MNTTITDQQKEFLDLCMIEQLTYRQIAEKMNVPGSQLSKWYEELKEERLNIAAIRILWLRKKINLPFRDFYYWYLKHEKKCVYCDIREPEIHHLLDTNRLHTKRLATRGKKLELDRKDPNLHYDDLNNLVFACYWCNNAKTDTFTFEEFKQVGEVFKGIWKRRIEDDTRQPNE
jgi:5-methylcytosine-specific restriction endonuclease McrA